MKSLQNLALLKLLEGRSLQHVLDRVETDLQSYRDNDDFIKIALRSTLGVELATKLMATYQHLSTSEWLSFMNSVCTFRPHTFPKPIDTKSIHIYLQFEACVSSTLTCTYHDFREPNFELMAEALWILMTETHATFWMKPKQDFLSRCVNKIRDYISDPGDFGQLYDFDTFEILMLSADISIQYYMNDVIRVAYHEDINRVLPIGLRCINHNCTVFEFEGCDFVADTMTLLKVEACGSHVLPWSKLYLAISMDRLSDVVNRCVGKLFTCYGPMITLLHENYYLGYEHEFSDCMSTVVDSFANASGCIKFDVYNYRAQHTRVSVHYKHLEINWDV